MQKNGYRKEIVASLEILSHLLIMKCKDTVEMGLDTNKTYFTIYPEWIGS